MQLILRQLGRGRWRLLWLMAFIIGAGALWLTWQREPGHLSQLAPAGALAYFEIEQPLSLAEQLSGSRAWTGLAPLLGWSRKPGGMASLSRVLALARLGQQNLKLLASARFALILTGIEAEGSAVKLKLALVMQTTLGATELEAWLRPHLKQAADEGYGTWSEGAEMISERRIHIYQSHETAHRIVWSVIDHLAIIANEVDSIRLIIETHDHQKPSLEGIPRFVRLRDAASASAPLFGYMSSEALAEALERSIWPNPPHSTETRFLAEILRTLLGAFSFSLGYQLEVEDGLVVERYRMLSQPGFLSELSLPRAAVNRLPDSLRFIPQTSKSFTILRLPQLGQVISHLDTVLKQRLSTVSSVALQELLIRLKQSIGLDQQDTISDTLGDEVALVEGNQPDLLFIIHTRNKEKMAVLIGKYLQNGGGEIETARVLGAEVYSSTDKSRESFSFLGDTLLMGPESLIAWAIEAHHQGSTMDHKAGVTRLLEKYGQGAVELSVRLDHAAEAQRVKAILQKLAAERVDEGRVIDLIGSLPPTLRTTRVSSEGIVSETRSPLGDLPFWFL